MFVQMQGRRGQGDVHEQREIIRKLATDENTKLCLVVEPCGSYGIQDDTAVPLNLNFELIDLYDKVFMNLNGYMPTDLEKDLILPIVQTLFDKKGLVVVDCRTIGKTLRELLMQVMENYYWQHVRADKMNKTHLIYILPAE